MPAITTSPADTKVLVSGANGFIAVWVCQKLLEKGYNVRGAVRTAAKGDHLKAKFKSFGNKLEIVVVEDITADGAFDEAVKGVDAIEHTASPFHFNSGNPSDYVDPAVKGTTGILKSALKNGTNVKRIVVTSSVASIMRVSKENIVLTEKDWNLPAVKEIEEKGSNASRPNMYQASKTLAEQAAWKFYEENKPSWDLTVLNPGYVFGPVIHEVSQPDDLNTSCKIWYDTVVNGSGLSDADRLASNSSYIDVRDLAAAHVKAIETEAAGGERFIIVAQPPFNWQTWWDAANSLSPSTIPSHKLPVGTPSSGKGVNYPVLLNTEKQTNILGLKYLTMEETARDTLADFERRGW